TLPRDYAIELEYNMHNRLFSGNSSVASNNLLNFKAKKTFCNDKILLSAGIDNILNEPNRYQSLLSDYQLNSKSKIGSEGRVMNVTLTYNFNAGKKIQQRRVENSSSEERGRISQSQQ
nr:outer membrane beta-barrel protein [Bacteroidaceae bacterium]